MGRIAESRGGPYTVQGIGVSYEELTDAVRAAVDVAFVSDDDQGFVYDVDGYLIFTISVKDKEKNA